MPGQTAPTSGHGWLLCWSTPNRSGSAILFSAKSMQAEGNSMRLTIGAALTAAAFTVLLSAPGFARGYPNGQIRMIVPVPAGGVTDTMARIVAQGLGESVNQTVVVDNRPGGNYSVGVQAAARSPADGLTLLVAPDSPITANPHLFSKLAYDPIADLTPIIVLCR